MSRSIFDTRSAIALSTLATLALILPACIIPGLPDDDDDTAADTDEGSGMDASATGGSADESGEDESADETSGEDEGSDESGGVLNTCDPEEVGAHVYQHDGSTEGEHWELGIHVVNGSFTVEGPLSVEPCSIIEMTDGARFYVGSGGSIQWLGLEGEPITVTSSKVSPSEGDWDHIRIQADSVGPDNVMDYVVIEYGGGSYYGALHLQDGASLAMSHSAVHGSAGHGMVVEGQGELREFVGNTFSNNAEGALQISPEHAGDLGEGIYAPNAVEGIFLSGPPVSHDQTWLAHDAPYVAPSGFNVNTAAGSAHLTIEAGAEIRMGDGTDITVGSLAGLTLEGSAMDPIVIRSMKSAGSPGDWDEIRIEDDSVDGQNSFSHVIIEHGGGSYYGALWVRQGASLAMRDSTVRDSGDFGMLVDHGAEIRDFTGNTFENNEGAAMSIGANQVDELGVGTYGPNSVDGIIVRSADVDHDAQWIDAGVPYLAADGFQVQTDVGSAVLTLNAGVEIWLGDSGDIFVQDNGALTADGSADDHVVIRSSKASPAAGDWDEIRIEDGSLDAYNVFRYTEISHGGGSYYGMLWVRNGASLALENVTFDAPGGGCDLLRDGTVNSTDTNFVECP